MLTGLLIGALTASALVQQTDTIIEANGATRLSLESFRGGVVVRSWDRDAVRVAADHGSSYSVSVYRSGSAVYVEPEVERGLGLAKDVNFEVTLPRSFGVDIEGVALNVDVQGIEGEVDVSTVHGPIRVVGGRRSVVLESVNGEIHLEDARGDMEITGVAGMVTILNCSGDLYAESVGGDLTLEGISSSDVEVGTVGGSLRFEGSIQDGGMYNFGSHGGSIWLYLPEGINAEVDAVTLAGEIEVDYPGAPGRPSSRGGIPGLKQKEMSFDLGTGSAQIEVETFAGTIHILRRGG